MIKKINKLYLYINKPVKETILFFKENLYYTGSKQWKKINAIITINNNNNNK